MEASTVASFSPRLTWPVLQTFVMQHAAFIRTAGLAYRNKYKQPVLILMEIDKENTQEACPRLDSVVRPVDGFGNDHTGEILENAFRYLENHPTSFVVYDVKCVIIPPVESSSNDWQVSLKESARLANFEQVDYCLDCFLIPPPINRSEKFHQQPLYRMIRKLSKNWGFEFDWLMGRIGKLKPSTRDYKAGMVLKGDLSVPMNHTVDLYLSGDVVPNEEDIMGYYVFREEIADRAIHLLALNIKPTEQGIGLGTHIVNHILQTVLDTSTLSSSTTSWRVYLETPQQKEQFYRSQGFLTVKNLGGGLVEMEWKGQVHKVDVVRSLHIQYNLMGPAAPRMMLIDATRPSSTYQACDEITASFADLNL